MSPSRWTPPPLTEPRTVRLTYRQADVLHGICLGWSNERIGAHFGITAPTVATHVKRLLAAMNAVTRGHAAALACSGQVLVLVSAVPGDKRRAA